MSHLNSSNAGIFDSNTNNQIVRKRKRGPGRPKTTKRRETTKRPKGLLDLFHHYPVFDRICSFLGTAEIRSLTRTCTQLSGVYHDLLRTQWNVDTQLRRFVNDPYEFRSQLGRHDALIAGSFALQYFERVVWEEAALDVFVEEKFGADFTKYLSKAEGYRLSSTEWLEPHFFDMKEKAETHVKSTTGSEIRVIYTHNIPIQTILTSSSTTADINVISWNKAYSIFPLYTFVHHKTYHLIHLDDELGHILTKYSRRGWRSQGILWRKKAGLPYRIKRIRRIGDCFTWVIPFDIGNVKWSKTPDYVLEHAAFKVRDNFLEVDRYYEIEAGPYSASVLQYHYTGLKFFKSIIPKLDCFAQQELFKLPENQRPSFFAEALEKPYDLNQYDGQFEPPASWTYVDDEIPGWYEVWEERQRKRQKRNDKIMDLEDDKCFY